MKCKNPFLLKRLEKVSLDSAPHKDFETYVPCGKCLYCRIQRRREWTLRILHENDYHKESCFITLTYDECKVPKTDKDLLTLRKNDLYKFLKRVRKRGEKVKYYAAGEYGEPSRILPNGYITKGERPHYHIILMGKDYLRGETYLDTKSKKIKIKNREMDSLWNYGDYDIGTVSADSIRYTAQYLDKKIFGDEAEEHYNGREPEFQSCSKGIGLIYVEQNFQDLIGTNYINYRGFKRKIPRYYIRKIEEVMDLEQKAKFQRIRRDTAREKQKKEVNALVEIEEEFYKLPPMEKDKILIERKRIGKQSELNLKAKAKLYLNKRLESRL